MGIPPFFNYTKTKTCQIIVKTDLSELLLTGNKSSFLTKLLYSHTLRWFHKDTLCDIHKMYCFQD